MKKRSLWIVLAIVGAALIGGYFLWQRSQASSGVEELRTAVVERGSLQVVVSASGSIEPETQVALGFDMPGRVTEVLVEVGDTVRAGDPLARVDSEQLGLQVQQAQAALAMAEAQLAQVQAGARSEEISALEGSLQAAQAQVSAAAAARDQLEAGATDAQIAAAEAQVAAAMMEQRMAQEAHDQTMKCYEMPDGSEICPGLGTMEEQARYALHAANEGLEAAQAQLDALLEGAAGQTRAAQAGVWAAAAQRDTMQAQLDLAQAGATEEQAATVEAGVAQARAALGLAELMLEHATLRAPFDGVIAAVSVTEGQLTGGGMPAMTLVDISRFHVAADVDEIDVAELAAGQPVEVTLDALPYVVLDGTIERIAPAAAVAMPTGLGMTTMGVVSYDMTVTLDETDAPIRAGMSANATVIVEELTDILLIPTWVVRIDRQTGQTYIYRRVGEGQTERVDVQLGARGNGVVQVFGGLEEGDVVVLIQEEVIDVLLGGGQ